MTEQTISLERLEETINVFGSFDNLVLFALSDQLNNVAYILLIDSLSPGRQCHQVFNGSDGVHNLR